jgi:phospholipid/cholesterol/gamma-HCH transport system substrate-binding protein
MEKTFESIIGTIILIIFTFSIFQVFKVKKLSDISSTYEISGVFKDVSGIDIGSEVKVGGVKIGQVSNLSLNTKNFNIHLSMKINNNISLASDSVASVVSNGIFGSKYISIAPGFDENTIPKQGGSISMTRSSLNIEDLVNKFVTK